MTALQRALTNVPQPIGLGYLRVMTDWTALELLLRRGRDWLAIEAKEGTGAGPDRCPVASLDERYGSPRSTLTSN
jgi:hypothetical protein